MRVKGYLTLGILLVMGTMWVHEATSGWCWAGLGIAVIAVVAVVALSSKGERARSEESGYDAPVQPKMAQAASLSSNADATPEIEVPHPSPPLRPSATARKTTLKSACPRCANQIAPGVRYCVVCGAETMK